MYTRQSNICKNREKIIRAKIKNSHISVKEQYDILFNEYQLGIEHTKRYTNAVNWCLNLTFGGLGALLTVTLKENAVFIYKIICIYVIPIFIYTFGLNYIYTLYMIGNVEDYLCNLENKMRCFSKNNNIIEPVGWNTYMSKKGNKINFLVYSFLSIVFVPYPIASVFFGKFNTIYGGGIKNLKLYPKWHIGFEVIFPCLLYLLYIVVGAYLIYKNMSIRTKKVKNILTL